MVKIWQNLVLQKPLKLPNYRNWLVLRLKFGSLTWQVLLFKHILDKAKWQLDRISYKIEQHLVTKQAV